MRIGVDLGGTKIEAVAIDAGGAELERLRVPAPRGDYPRTLEEIRRLVAALEARVGPGRAVGIGTPGAISPATGRMKNSNSTWLNDRPLHVDLERALGRPVRLANDANCFALAEARTGAGRDSAVVFGVILGTGCGGGIVVRGQVIEGPNAIAGEWGHNPLPWPLPWPHDDERPGPSCYCGRSGCIETFLSGTGLARDHERATGVRKSGEEIVESAGRGEPSSLATLERYHDRLARALASVVNLLDPDVIVLGGGLSRIPSLYREVPARWGRWVFSDRVDTRLVPPLHGDAAGALGAAWLWQEEEKR